MGALASASETAVDLVSSELLLPAARVRKHQKESASANEIPFGDWCNSRLRTALPGSGRCYLAVTAEVMEAITMEAILKASSRSVMWWRRAIQVKSV